MEPQTPQTMQTPPQSPMQPTFTPPQQPQKRGLNKRVLILVAIGIIVIGGIIAAVLLNKKPSDQDNASGVTVVKRDGYTQASDGIADPMALVEKESKPVVNYKGSSIIQACSLFTFKDIKDNNQLIQQGSLTGSFARTYFDGQGTGEIEMSSDLFYPLTPRNECAYSLENKGQVHVDVFQNTYINSGVAAYTLGRYNAETDINGAKVYSKPLTSSASRGDTETKFFMVRKHNVDLDVMIDLPKNEQLESSRKKILESIVNNLDKAATTPKGPATYAYESDAFKKSSVIACDVTTVDDFMKLFGKPAAPFVHEEYGTSVGITNYSTFVKDATDYAYTQNKCVRSTGEDSSTQQEQYIVGITNYTSDVPPKHDMAFSKSQEETVELSSQVGDESYIVVKSSTKDPGSVQFRKGRFLVNVEARKPSEPSSKTDPKKRGESILPIAKAIADRLKD